MTFLCGTPRNGGANPLRVNPYSGYNTARGVCGLSHWRERYDLLRLEHESILRRMADVEAERRVGPALSRFAPQRSAQIPASAEYSSVADAVVAPLLRLRDEYLAAAGKIDTVVGGLEGLAMSAFRDTRPVGSAPEPNLEPTTAPEPRRKPTRIQVDVRAKGFGELLDFQERLSEMNGVASVSVNAIDSERATLTVELAPTAEGVALS